MKKTNEILYVRNARNAEHYQLYSSMSGLVTEEVATKYGLTTYRNRLRKRRRRTSGFVRST